MDQAKFSGLKRHLADAVDASRRLGALVADLPEDDIFRSRFGAWLGTANKILTSEAQDPTESLADHLAALESAARRARPESWPKTNFGGEVKASWGALIADIVTAQETARELGQIPRDPGLPADTRYDIDSAHVGNVLQGLLSRLSYLTGQLESLRVEAQEERKPTQHQAQLIAAYTKEMEVEASLVRAEATSRSSVDIALIGRAVERMTELTAGFSATVTSLGKLFSQAAREATDAVRKGVARIVRGTRAIVRILRDAASRDTDDEPIQLAGAPIELGPEKDLLNQVTEALLRGNIPPTEAAAETKTLTLENTTFKNTFALAAMVNLQQLNLHGSKVTDLSPLVGLQQLHTLDLRETPIIEIWPLQHLRSLRRLYLGRTQVADIRPLQTLSSLRELSLEESFVHDGSSLSFLQDLEILRLDGAPILDFFWLGRLNLRILTLTRTKLGNLAMLSRMSQLQRLNVAKTDVRDLAPLIRLSELTALGLSDTNISDLASVSSLRHLAELSLDRTNIWELTPLAGLLDLKSLSVHDTKIRSLTSIGRLEKLTYIDAGRTHVMDLAPISHNRQLRVLKLHYAPISDIRALTGMKDLEVIDLAGTNVSDLSPLSEAKKLRVLSLNDTHVKDLSPLAGHDALELLDLTASRVDTLDAVKHVRKVKNRRGQLVTWRDNRWSRVD